MTKTKRRALGDIGEGIACRFLMKRGFTIKDRNYQKKWGEIDVIAEKKGRIHFVEVKSVARNPGYYVSGETLANISHKTLEQDRPEENIHEKKIQRIYRAIQSYVSEKRVSHETQWQIDALAVFLDTENKQARVRYMEHIA